MSQEKHDQLLAEGRLNPDGSRKKLCPTCGQQYPEGSALAQPEAVAVATGDSNQEA